MALSANRDLKFYVSQELIELPVKDNVLIYKNAFVGRDRATGYVRGLVAGDEFVGVSYQCADNTIPGHAAGGINVRVHQAVDLVHALTGVTVADIGKDVYASDDSTLTLSPTGNSRIGRVIGVEGTNLARVRCQPMLSLDGVLDNLPVISLADANATLTLDQLNRTVLMPNTTARTLTLPPATTARAGAWLRVVKTSAAAAAVTLDANSTELIDGSQTYAGLDAQYDTVLLLCTGTGWIILSRDVA